MASETKKNDQSDKKKNDPTSTGREIQKTVIKGVHLADDVERQKKFREKMNKLEEATTNVSTESKEEPGKNPEPAPADPPKKASSPIDAKTGVPKVLPVNLKDLIKTALKLGARKILYKIEHIQEVLDLAMKSFKEQESLVELEAPANVCGDIHGQYSDLMAIFRSCGFPFQKRYLFLGDYVDRGRHSIEVTMLLFACKIKYPKHIVLLRGNHELMNINKNYGFKLELLERYRSDAEALFQKFNQVFAQIPYAGLISKKILCMHGGLSPFLNTLDDIRKLERGLVTLKKDTLQQDLLWSDPEHGVEGYKPNIFRKVSCMFGESVVTETCKRLNIDIIIRAHQVVEFGYAFFANRQMITVFSASRYVEEENNYCGVVRIQKNLELTFLQLKPDHARFPNGQKDKEDRVRTMDADDELERKSCISN